MSLKKKLVGAWRLVDWGVIDGANVDKILPPLGLPENSGGLLIYTESGIMSATLSRKDRPFFTDCSLDGGTSQERAEAFASITRTSPGLKRLTT
ncbi:lipocalin-like domain-containing protein [Dickeya dianthicola]|uniref:lipocalin-like domain-containing protein n=1 Tax=Dickeya dianthicola TaxID=204039 RepID=UPI00136A4833|nr:lipocalin-like domain-containing protein [Dickeya dianthicola]MZI87940.1 lipocalin-like domain-containing protein [Dickeya dianthicola]